MYINKRIYWKSLVSSNESRIALVLIVISSWSRYHKYYFMITNMISLVDLSQWFVTSWSLCVLAGLMIYQCTINCRYGFSFFLTSFITLVNAGPEKVKRRIVTFLYFDEGSTIVGLGHLIVHNEDKTLRFFLLFSINQLSKWFIKRSLYW